MWWNVCGTLCFCGEHCSKAVGGHLGIIDVDNSTRRERNVIETIERSLEDILLHSGLWNRGNDILAIKVKSRKIALLDLNRMSQFIGVGTKMGDLYGILGQKTVPVIVEMLNNQI